MMDIIVLADMEANERRRRRVSRTRWSHTAAKRLLKIHPQNLYLNGTEVFIPHEPQMHASMNEADLDYGRRGISKSCAGRFARHT